MEIQPRINRYIKWFCCLNEITFSMAFCLFIADIILFGVMTAYYHGVVNDNRLINDNHMFRMLQESVSFMKNIKQNVHGNRLLKDYRWLTNFSALIHKNCHVTSSNLKYLQVIGYVLAGYNTFLMHILLSGVLPVSALACLSILASFISGYINQSNIIVLGLFEFSQSLLSLVIMVTFIFIKERKIKSQLILDKLRFH